jgi:hypothetical protein
MGIFEPIVSFFSKVMDTVAEVGSGALEAFSKICDLINVDKTLEAVEVVWKTFSDTVESFRELAFEPICAVVEAVTGITLENLNQFIDAVGAVAGFLADAISGATEIPIEEWLPVLASFISGCALIAAGDYVNGVFFLTKSVGQTAALYKKYPHEADKNPLDEKFADASYNTSDSIAAKLRAQYGPKDFKPIDD